MGPAERRNLLRPRADVLAQARVLAAGFDDGRFTRLFQVLDRAGNDSAALWRFPSIEAVLDWCETEARRDPDRAEPTAVLVDARIGEREIVRLLRHFEAWRAPASVVVLAEASDEALLVTALLEGAVDFQLFEQLDPEALLKTLGHAVQVARWKGRAFESARRAGAATSDLRAVLAAVEEGLLVLDGAGRIRAVGGRAQWILGRSAPELVGQRFDDLSWSPAEVRTPGDATLADRLAPSPSPQLAVGTYAHYRRPDGQSIRLRIWSHSLVEDGGDLAMPMILGFVPAPEAAGEAVASPPHSFAGVAVAHDLANLLTAIRLSCQSLADSETPAGPAAARLAHLADATGRLLARFRGDDSPAVAEPREADRLLHGERSLIEAMVGPRVDVQVRLAAPGAKVRIVNETLERVLANLVANAREAMPAGGRLLLRTAVVEREVGEAKRRFWSVEITDSGRGMDAATRARAFELFFTTKSEAGSGIGLATVRQLVENQGGEVSLLSESGAGTTFRILLPMVDEPGERRQ
ncbi:MAG: ATP-binding protein [Thermoanaerobaculia bacterium]